MKQPTYKMERIARADCKPHADAEAYSASSEDRAALSNSINESGLLSPIAVIPDLGVEDRCRCTKDGEDSTVHLGSTPTPKYLVIDGIGRLNALMAAGVTETDAQVFDLGRQRVPPRPGLHAWVPKSAATPPDQYVLCRWSRQSDGTYEPVPVAGRYVRLGSKTATLLGFPLRTGEGGGERCRYDTILRLGRAGFVDVVRIAPNTILLDLDSWYRHLADCIDDPDRWDEGKEDRETYLNANGLGGWKRLM